MSNICGLGVSDRSVSGAQPALRVSAVQAVGGGSVFAPSAGMVLDFTSASIDATLASLGFVFARASTATRINASGVMESVASGVMRIEHDPVTGAPLGYLCEETSTNHVRNSTMVGAAAGSPGTLPTNWTFSTQSGVTASVVATGTENGIAYVECRFVGTASTAGDLRVSFEANTQVAASSGQSWTESAYFALANGSAPSGRTFNITINERNSGGSQIVANQSANIATSLTSTLRRFSFSVASTNASTAFIHPYFGCFIGVGAVVDFTIRIGAPQLEQKAFATSFIPTAGSALTRQLDALTLGDLSRIGFNPAASSVIVQGRILGQSALVYPGVVALGMGVEGDKVVLYRDGASSRFVVEAKTAGVTQYLLSVTAAPATGAEYKTAFAFAANDAAQTTSGAAPVKDASVALSTILDRMSIGGFQARGGGTNGAQIIRRVDYYPRRLADAELQSITT